MQRIGGPAALLAAACWLSTGAGIAQEPIDVPLAPTTSEREPGLRRQESYFGLWPFFSREIYEDGSRRWSSLGGAVRVESQSDGDWHHHVLPFYCASLWEGGTDRELALFPLLYLGRSRPERHHDIVLPLFYRWRVVEARHTLLWPLFHVATSPEPGPFRWVPTLFRHGSEASGATRTRLGFAPYLELFEQASDDAQRAWTALNLFNFDDETRGGLPLARYRRHGDDSYSTHLFPLYFLGRAGDERGYCHTPLAGAWHGPGGLRGLSIPPLIAWGSRSEAGYGVHALGLFHFWDGPEGWGQFAVPFYWAGGGWVSGESGWCYSLAYWLWKYESPPRTTHIAPLLLSSYSSDETSSSLNILWPLIHRSREVGDRYAWRALPFLDAHRSTDRRSLGIGGILYRRHERFAEETVSHWVLMPLGHWKRTPEEIVAWGIPAFYWRRGDYVRSETRKRREVRTLFVAPSYFSSVRTDRDAIDATRTRTQTSRSFHLWPLYGSSRRETLEEVQGSPPASIGSSRWLSTLTPFFAIGRDRHGDAAAPLTTTVQAPWPLVEWKSTGERYDFRMFPPLYAGSRPERAYFYLYPALSVETGPEASDGFWHWTSLVHWYSSGDHLRFNVFPLIFGYEDEVDTIRVTGPLWLWRYRASPGSGWFHLLPLGFGKWGEEESALGVFPFFYRRDTGAQAMRPFSAWRYFFLVNHLQGDAEEHWSFLWKVYERHAEADGDSETRVLHRLYLRRDVEGQRQLVINPFLDRSLDERTGDSTLAVLKVLYRDVTRDGERTVRVLGIPVWRETARQ